MIFLILFSIYKNWGNENWRVNTSILVGKSFCVLKISKIIGTHYIFFLIDNILYFIYNVYIIFVCNNNNKNKTKISSYLVLLKWKLNFKCILNKLSLMIYWYYTKYVLQVESYWLQTRCTPWNDGSHLPIFVYETTLWYYY